ncbi:hypothetical protein [Streptomyces sp. NPDC050738]|uniref:hypothetical protein n=1 Tax=Streptomyces sp. NPDC050738 TaxID=3154744 RepID=UPI0034323912
MSKLNAWRTTGLRAITAGGLALAAAISAAGAAHSASAPITDPKNEAWGTVVETDDGVQADAWQARVRGLGNVVDARLFEAAYPTTPKAPETQGGGSGLVDLAPKGLGLGKVSAYSKPGKAVSFTGGAARGYISVAGHRAGASAIRGDQEGDGPGDSLSGGADPGRAGGP